MALLCSLHFPAGDSSWSAGGQQHNGEQQPPKSILQFPVLHHSNDSITREEYGSSSSVEDLKLGKETETQRQETPFSERRLSDECYANPVDAINEFLTRDPEFGSLTESEPNESPKSIVPQTETESATHSPGRKSLGEEPWVQEQQMSKEIQLQLFHERLFKDHTSTTSDRQTPSNGSSEVDTDSIHNRAHDYSEIDDEPTYSNPFDALAESAYRPPYRVKTDKLKRNISMSSSSIQLPSKQQPSRCSNSPPPPPVPLKDDKKVAGGLSHRPMRYGRRESGENEPRGANPVTRSGSSASISSVPQQRAWERREPVWKRNNSRRGSEDSAFVPQRAMTDEEKPEAPLSVAERLRQLRLRSQSDGLTQDEVRLQSRPPMPLPILEREPARGESGGSWGQVRLNGQSHHMTHAANNNDSREENRGSKSSPSRQKAWLERTVSDQQQSVYFARRGMAHVVPLSAREIVKQHISHAAP